MRSKTAVLLIGFGGPSSMAEVQPFLNSVLEGVQIPQSRFDDVMHHYELFNGLSPYNEVTHRQKAALSAWFKAQGEAFPVYIGLRHAPPVFKAAFDEMKRDGVEQAIGFVLSSFRCDASFERYVRKLEEARNLSGFTPIAVDYTDNFSGDRLFHEAQAERVASLVPGGMEALRQRTFFIFSAHSVPVPMSEQSGYAHQFKHACSKIAGLLKITDWDCGYQSRSGRPMDPWLEPDVKEIIRSVDPKRFDKIALIPAGFLCDNVEVLYDLDIEAKQAALDQGLGYLRAPTVTDHPKFIEMIGTQVLGVIARSLPADHARNDDL